ncbi:hypothetical protein [Rheinheimera soli]|uniref:hypothetical protein n=1 Tax=Rheinheimera soli TaxID=443616 RepID=UPI001E2A7861|nr:hypothetical protein [Rheinheimera soli]
MKFIASLLLLFSFILDADSWLPPEPMAVLSADASILVRVEPGVLPNRDASNQPHFAKASFFRWDNQGNYQPYQQLSLRNKVLPLLSYASNQGELITIDNWYNPGHGEVVVIYKADGSVLKSFGLSAFYSKQQLEQLLRSVSSVQWRCFAKSPYLLQRDFYLPIRPAGVIKINLDDASVSLIDSDQSC